MAKSKLLHSWAKICERGKHFDCNAIYKFIWKISCADHNQNIIKILLMLTRNFKLVFLVCMCLVFYYAFNENITSNT